MEPEKRFKERRDYGTDIRKVEKDASERKIMIKN